METRSAPRASVLVGLVLCLAASSAVRAAEFAFTVPLELRNIPPGIYIWSVLVQVYDRVWPPPPAYSENIGYGRYEFYFDKYKTGEFVGNVTVNVTLNPGKQVKDVVYYRAALVCNEPNGSPRSTPDYVMKQGGPYPYDPTKPFVYLVDGSLTFPLVQKRQLAPLHH
jgi:hypothetical protein